MRPIPPEGKRLLASQGEGVGLLGLLIQPLPFVKAIGGDEAAPAMKRNSAILDDKQRVEVLAYVQHLIREARS
jgi:hypothetical protein